MKTKDVELITSLEHIRTLIEVNPKAAMERITKLIRELKG